MKQSKSGFTIVELLIVIVVIGILAAIVIVAYNGVQGRANNVAVQTDLRNNAQKIARYVIDTGSMPNFTQLTGDYQLAYTKQSYATAIYCKTATHVIIVSTSASGTSYFIDTDTNNIQTLTTGDPTACATFGITGGSPSPSIATVYNGATWSVWVK